MPKSLTVALALGLTFAAPSHASQRSTSRDAEISAMLHQRTQAFSDAGQAGDGATLAQMLDDRVVFVNEGGDIATKADMASSKPPTSPIKTVMTVEDWQCEVHGDVAVATFVDDQKQDFHGQPFHARYRSVETWLQNAGAWRMIGSQTVALLDDPKALTVSPEALDAYVGAYQAAPGVQVIFSRSGKDLMVSGPGTPPTAQKASSPDVFFTPGRSRATKVFERGPDGKVTGFDLRREGHDIHFRRVAG